MLDLMGARQTIDILGILKDKTKGNLTPRGGEHAAQRALRTAHGLSRSDQPARQSAQGRRPARELMKATLTVLGSGTSMGVPTIGCDCAVCTSSDPHDRRLRPSIMVQ